MVRDDNNIKFADEEQNKPPSERVPQFAEDLEISSEDTRTTEVLHEIQKRPWLNLALRYVSAILVVILAFWLYSALTALFGPGLPTYILFYPAIIIVALIAGLGPGLLATIVSVMMAIIWIIPSSGQFTLRTPIEEIGVVLFTSIGIMISSVSELYRRNRNKAAAYDKEKALRETRREKEFLADILEHASQPFAVGYPDGRLGLHNQAFEQLTGYTTEELHTIDWSTTLTPIEWREMEKKRLDELNRTGQPVLYEKEYIRKDGSRVPIELLVNLVLDLKGNPEYYYSFITDITERKQIETALKKSEQILAEAQHIAHIGSWEWNLKTGDINWSNELYSIYRVDPNTFTPALSSFADYMHPDDEEYVNQRVQLLSKGKSQNFDFRIILDDGSIRVLNTLAEVAEFDKNGKPGIIVGINQDITERKEIELKLNENIKKLAQSNKELEQFAYITSHDLREPLRMITSFLQLLERRYHDQLDQDANEFIGFAVDGAKRLDVMTNDLLQYSKISSQKKEIIPVNFEHVLKHALENLKVQIEESNAIITHDPLPTINGDKQLKVQLFQNIIGNAIKYRSEKPPKIHISATKEKNQYLFSIKDNGIGMSSKHLEKIFTIFQRLHTQEDYEGTGIGLAIAQKIVHQQGGQIWVESEPGKGSTFYFTIIIKE
ncbi:PAS domain S-box protein [Methanobacterium spitsbergense]|uniref:histidine kinase n=1 Tax=Methanobacterium spitsbergense TaxID=2874285 RepID=A0A8T5USP5_9EURY|nr:PAS domain S-box protein [Methanobacterium spitsbergense]MBZ2166778.1 PAS domain S-box protein [Methanobacterium spitsbergense]